ncbi:MAG: enoyl-CoA hydratase/isomerase family protein [Pseudomonadota bacterium]
MTDQVLLDYQGNIARVTLSRAQQRNALTNDMLRRLEEVALELRDQDSIRAVVVQAEGEHFSVGMDISAMSDRASANLLAMRRVIEQGGRTIRALQEIPQPTICALQGIATGGGACIATACDFRVAAAGARLGYGEVKLGMNLMWNAVPACVALVGPARAKRLIMSGELFGAQTLETWGMVDEVCEASELTGRAMSWAEEYAALPPIALQMIKRSIDHVSGALDQATMHADVDQWLLSSRSADFAEALAAFMEKRPGSFEGN